MSEEKNSGLKKPNKRSAKKEQKGEFRVLRDLIFDRGLFMRLMSQTLQLKEKCEPKQKKPF